MHGLVNHSIQLFVTTAHGKESWLAVVEHAGLEFTDFESMMVYDDSYTPRVIDAICHVLSRMKADVLEDFGTFLVSHPGFEAVRRLLRFGGDDFVDFLHSLDDLSDSARLAVSGLNLPKVELHAQGDNQFKLICDAQIEGYGFVMMGVLRAMADEYGALALLDHLGHADDLETVAITLVENDFAEGRSFDLAANFG
ncbi:MAG: heme NO-binding domain-containing protein [Pseudomonadota bacterium]